MPHCSGFCDLIFPGNVFSTPGKLIRTHTPQHHLRDLAPSPNAHSVETLSISNLSTMAQAPKHCTLIGCCRRKPKHQATPNEHWLHISSCESCQMGTPQMLMATASLFCMSLNQLRVLILTSKTVVTTHANLAVQHSTPFWSPLSPFLAYCKPCTSAIC